MKVSISVVSQFANLIFQVAQTLSFFAVFVYKTEIPPLEGVPVGRVRGLLGTNHRNRSDFEKKSSKNCHWQFLNFFEKIEF